MRYPSTILPISELVLGFCLVLTGCARAPSESPTAAPISVAVSHPFEREVTDYADFTARTAAVNSLEVRARVTGYLVKMPFKEGALVKAGDLLFEIDPRPYRAQYEQAEGQVRLNEASLNLARANYERNRPLVESRAISPQELDQYAATVAETQAQVEASKASLVVQKLNLDFTQVTAPVDGRVSRYFLTLGNRGNADQTLPTTVVSVDPMYAYFDVDERTVQRVQPLIREGKAKSASETVWPVSLGLATEKGFSHQGTINFVDNQVNPKTGTLRVRGVFPNKDESLSPGFFARVRVPIGPPHQALLVSDRALDNDQGQKILYVVNDKKVVVSRAVRVGAVHDGLREIEDGLKPGERVIVNGLQLVRPGLIVEPKLTDMPVSTADRRSADMPDTAPNSPTTPTRQRKL